jgi:hypothetical protein
VVPAGTFLLRKRLIIAQSRPFVLRGIAPDASRLVWAGNTTEGIAVNPCGKADPLMNDALVTVSRARTLCSCRCSQTTRCAFQGTLVCCCLPLHAWRISS